MFDEMLSEKSKIKIGVVSETPFLPVSAAVRRSVELSKKALIDEGYDVVDFHISAEEYADARNFLIGMVAPTAARLSSRDFMRTGENYTLPVFLNTLIIELGCVSRWFLLKILGAVGMGRSV
mmetsp:Transcript_11487/g.19443  ORF Transcript_11487/g.19443 Transcript_11487/m.19443 type:complete len:122 (-) Transcript_11487:532-897(-)